MSLALPTAPDRGAIQIQPSKIVGIGRNYLEHARELGNELPAEPVVFLVAPSALIGAEQAIVRPPGWQRVDYEGELAVVLGARAKDVSRADALACVRGYACANDVTVRDLQRPGPWALAKGMDTFCPLGPRLVTDLDPSDLAIETRLNGAVVQSARTSQMAFDIPFLIEYLSARMTLEPGDVILTGTPAGVGNLTPGDRVEVEIEGIGVLANPVVGATGR